MSGTIIGPEVDMAKVQVANLWDNGAGLINLNSPLVINDAGANGSINDRNNNVVIDPLGNITTYGTAEIETYFMLMDRMAGKTGDNITNVGNIVLNNSSGAGQVLDMAGNPLLDPLSGHVGSGKNLTDILLSITNASLNVDATRLTMVKSSNSPIASIKSLSAGANVTLTDQGTNVVIASTGGGGGGGTSIDLAMTNLTAFANSTNFYVDFAFPAATLTTSSNVINFNFATNWGLVNTTRVCNVTIPWTNYGRIVAFSGFATNWRVQPPVYFIPMGYSARMEFSSFGPLDTNVTLNTFFDPTPAGSNTTASFNPTNAFPGVVKLWVDASRGAFQDETLTVPVVDGSIMRGWNELSGTVTTLTNNATTAMVNVWHSPQGAPFNVTCCSIQNGANWLQSPAFTALSGQIWGFVMYYGRSGGNVIDATAGTRFAINPAQMGQVSSFFAGSGLTFTAARQASWTLYACLGNGVSSVMRSNGVVAVSGNAGNPTPSQWIVFGDNTKVNMIGTYNVAEILILNTNLSNTQLTNVESYFYRKYPFWNPPTVQ